MIGYITLGTNDLARAEAFYEALLAELGATRMLSDDRMRFFGVAGQPMLAVCAPYDEQKASVGNGTMVALTADSREAVDRIHAKALALGGTDDGAPGERGGDWFYGAYFRDLDGNKLVAFHMNLPG